MAYTEEIRNENGTPGKFHDPAPWEDIRFPFTGSLVDLTIGRLDYDYAECGVGFQANARYTDEPLCLICQMHHHKLLGSAVRPHLHWVQNQNAVPNWLIEYRYYNNGDAIPSYSIAKWSSAAFTYVSGSILQIVQFPEISAPVNEDVSALLDVRFFRDSADASGLFGAADPYTGTALAKEFDIHYQIDSFGSRQEYVK